MERQEAIARGFRCLMWMASSGAVSFAIPVAAQITGGAWPIGTIEPPGVEVPRRDLVGVSMAGDVAVSAYAGHALQGPVVMMRRPVAEGWSAPEVLMTGSLDDGARIFVDADAQRIAVGLPDAAGGGRIDVFRRDGDAWLLEQAILPPSGVTSLGIRVSLRGGLMVTSSVSRMLGGGVESFRHVPGTSSWEPAGYRIEAPLGFHEYFTTTDGERIATCMDSVGCRTMRLDDEGNWRTEATVGRPKAAVALAGGRLYAGGSSGAWSGADLVVYEQSAEHWIARQTLSGVRRFSTDGDRVAVAKVEPGPPESRTMQIMERDGDGSLRVVLAAPLAETALAVSGGRVLAGAQAFERIPSGAWQAYGLAGGVADLQGAAFGTSIAAFGHRLWIGAPGLAGRDVGSGGVWRQALAGSTLPSSVSPHLPSGPSLLRGFGRRMVVGGYDVAILSSHSTPARSVADVTLFGGGQADPQPYGVALSPIDGDASRIGLAISADAGTLAVSREAAVSGLARSEIAIFDVRGAVPLQTQLIGTWANGFQSIGVGTHAVLSGSGLLAGLSTFRRNGAGDQYLDTGSLPYPLNFSPSGVAGASSGAWVMIPGNDDTGSSIGHVMRYEADAWRSYGEVRRNGFVVPGGCKAIAMDGTDIACVSLQGGVMSVFLARGNGSIGSWGIVAGGSVPGGGGPWGTPFGLALSRGIAAVGQPIAAYPAGSGVGRVVLMTFDETILRAGFEAAAP